MQILFVYLNTICNFAFKNRLIVYQNNRTVYLSALYELICVGVLFDFNKNYFHISDSCIDMGIMILWASVVCPLVMLYTIAKKLRIKTLYKKEKCTD